MKLIDFIEQMDLNGKSELARATLLCFFSYKETQCCLYTMAGISELMEHSGYSRPNTSRLKERLTKGKGKVMLHSKTDKAALEFIPAVLQGLEKEMGNIWNDTEIIISSSELIEEVKFCGKRNYLDRLIKQINHCYKNNCFDACAVLMR